MTSGNSNTAGPYEVPIYQTIAPNGQPIITIYASLNGGPLDPYLLDSGSPNMFSTYGSWWPGHSTEVAQQGTASFEFANGLTYYYDAVPTDIALGSASGSVVASATNVNVALITNTNSSTPASDFANWASAVAAGNAPISSDDTYGNFSAGLYGSNSLATVLAQIPIGDNLKDGFIIQSGGITATTGSLTIGLDPAVIAAWEADPSTIVLAMAPSGTLLPNPDGNATAAPGYQKAQIGDSTVTLTNTGTSTSYQIPTVIDTGGGPNNIIYNPGGVPDLSGWLQPDSSTIANGVTYELSGTTSTGGTVAVLDYVTSGTALPGGGNSLAISDPNIPGTLRVNPGINLFDDYNVMFDLQDGNVLLQPLACFAAGTRIATEFGLVAVEQLRETDLLPTRIGGTLAAPRWIGHRAVDCMRHPNPAAVWPVRIAAGAFADGVPARDLYLSPDHAVYCDGVLIPVKYLINGTTIAQQLRASVTYYHVELARHDVILAEGLPVESYLAVGDRSAFANGGTLRQLHPDFAVRRWEAEGCAELIVTGPVLSKVRRRLSGRRLAASGGRRQTVREMRQ